MEETVYEIISKNPQIIKLIKNREDKKDDIFIGFSEVIEDDDEIQKIILIQEHEISNFSSDGLYEKVIIITKKYKYIPLIDGHMVDKDCNYSKMKGVLGSNYTFENQKLKLTFYGSVKDSNYVESKSTRFNGILLVSFVNNKYNYTLNIKETHSQVGAYYTQDTDKNIILEYDESIKKYIFTGQDRHSSSGHTHHLSFNIEEKYVINSIPLIKCVVLGDGDDVDKSDKLKAELSELQNKSDLNDTLIINLKTVNNKMSDEIINLKNNIIKLETENAELNTMNCTKDIFIDKLEKIIEKMTEEANQYCFRCYDKYIKSTKTINCEHKYICHHCTIILKECPRCNSPYN